MNDKEWKHSIYNRASTKYRVTCPYCEHKYYWTRPAKRNFEELGTVKVICRNCNKVYWIEKTKSTQGLYVRTNREE